MPNSVGLLGNGPTMFGPPGSSTQGVAAVRSISNPSQYYLFVLDAAEQQVFFPNGGYLRYSIIDMSLNGGLGDIIPVQKNIVIDSMLSEKMTITSNGCNYWLLTHRKDLPEYRAFKIDINGVGPNPVVSAVGIPLTTLSLQPYWCGEMKISPNKRMVALTPYNIPETELAEFDVLTGIVSNPINIDSTPYTGKYGIEFSPDSRRLYTGGSTGIYQFNLSLLPDANAVRNSRTNLGYGQYNGIRTGPDNKLYAAHDISNIPYVACINNPNALGSLCNLQPIAYALPYIPGTLIFGEHLGNPIRKLEVDTNIHSHDTVVCSTSVTVSAPMGFNSYNWSDGSTGQTTSLNVPGTKWVSSFNGCQLRIDTFHAVGATTDTTITMHDTTLCLGMNSYSLSAPPGYTSYLWSNGETTQTININQAGIVCVYCMRACELGIDSFTLHPGLLDTTISNTDSTICFLQALTLSSGQNQDHYLWNNGSTSSNITITQSSVNWLISQSGCNVDIDTFDITMISFDPDLGNDTMICPTDIIMLGPLVQNAQYLWHDGSALSTYQVAGPGTYWVTVSQGICAAADTIEITPKTISFSFGDDKLLCKNEILALDPGINGSHIWQDNSNEPVFSVTSPGTYWVQVSQGSCVAGDTIMIDYEICDCPAMLPTIFSPNLDGKNDAFGPAINCVFSGYVLRIYNRWGENIFTAASITEKWKGLHNNMPADVGVYYYTLSFTGPRSKKFFYKGEITLIR